jgi:hypothetical protein
MIEIEINSGKKSDKPLEGSFIGGINWIASKYKKEKAAPINKVAK